MNQIASALRVIADTSGCSEALPEGGAQPEDGGCRLRRPSVGGEIAVNTP